MNESATEPEVASTDQKLSSDEPKRRLSLSADGRGVEVEGPDGMLELVAVAAELWKLTERPPGRVFGFGSSTLYTERADPAADVDREDG